MSSSVHRLPDKQVKSALAKLILGRRTVRRFLPDDIAREVLEEILALALQAPSAHNSQPWRFVVLQNRTAKRALARAMSAELRTNRLRDGDSTEKVEADVSRSEARIDEAPAAILVCMTREDMDTYPDSGRNEAETTMGIQSAALAAGNVLLAAHASGLGACWMCAPLFCGDAVQAELELPIAWIPQALILLGYPMKAGKLRERRSMKEVVIWR